MILRKVPLIVLVILFIATIQGEAATRYYNGRWVDIRFPPQLDNEGYFVGVEDHFELAKQLYNEGNYLAAAQNFMIVVHHYEENKHRTESLYYAGVSYFMVSQFEKANEQFSAYLEAEDGGIFWDQVFQMKFYIAELYREGSWRPLKRDKALELYEEVIVAGRDKELIAKAFFGKGEILKNRRDYKSSIEAFETITRRFPKHPLSAESFIAISEVYLLSCERETQNPDFLDLARLNVQHFEKNFPGDPRIAEVNDLISQMEEAYANSLYETGRFYERKRKEEAAVIYFKETMKRYPQSPSAAMARERLNVNS